MKKKRVFIMHHPFISINLEADNKVNIRRYYTLMTSKDLFGDISLQTTYGRIGHKGQCKTYSFSNPQDCQKKIHQLIKKRLTAHKRIGINYEIVSSMFGNL